MALYHSQPYGNHDPLGELVKPPRAIDESSFREQKSDLLREPCSQDDWLSKIQGMDAYVNAMLELNEQVGPWFGCELAEGWNRHNPLGFAPSDFDAMRNLPQYQFLTGKIFEIDGNRCL